MDPTKTPSTHVPLSALLGLLLLAVGCGGGGGGTTPTGVAPQGEVGATGDAITFTLNGAPIDANQISWDFGGGASPNAVMSSGAGPIEPDLTVILGDPGVYRGLVKTQGGIAGAKEQWFDYVVSPRSDAPPQILRVSPGLGTLLGEPGATATFNATINGTAESFLWDFGLGATSVDPSDDNTATILVHAGAPGTYQGTVTAFNDAGATEPFGFSYRVGFATPESAIARVAPVQGFVGEVIRFTITETPPPTIIPPALYRWKFDGATFPSSAEGTTVGVRIRNAGRFIGTIEEVVQDVVRSRYRFVFFGLPSGGLTVQGVTPTGGDLGSEATFRALIETDAPVRYKWTFGGGVLPRTSSAARPVVTFTDLGNYTGKVVVYSAAGSSPPFVFPYSIDLPGLPRVSSVTPSGATVGFDGDALTFEAVASGSPTRFAWNFDGGAVPTGASNGPSVPVTLDEPGIYTGNLVVGNDVGESLPWYFIYRVERRPELPLITGVTPSGDLGLPGDPTVFAVTATNSPTEFSWNFGGGATPNESLAITPFVELGAPGMYTGSVQVGNPDGLSEVFAFSYSIAQGIPGVIQVSPTGFVGAEADLITFSAPVSGQVSGYAWDFGSGAYPRTSSATAPSVTLGIPGEYQGTLVVTGPGGSAAPFEFSYQVTANDAAPVIGQVLPAGVLGAPGAVVELSVQLTGAPTAILWEFDAGAEVQSQEGLTVTVELGAVGDYTGRVRAVSPAGTSAWFEFGYEVEGS